MEPFTLALKIICQPHLAMIYILEYAQQENQLQKTHEFREEIESGLKNIQDLLMKRQNKNSNNDGDKEHVQIGDVSIDYIDAIKSIEFSPNNLVALLREVDPIRINRVILALLTPTRICNIRVDVATLKYIRISHDNEKLKISFHNVYGKFWKNGNTRRKRAEQEIEVPLNFRGRYHGEITVRDFPENIHATITRRRTIKTASSIPVLTISGSTFYFITLELKDTILREIVVIANDGEQ